jgi:hypothetical protein
VESPRRIVHNRVVVVRRGDRRALDFDVLGRVKVIFGRNGPVSAELLLRVSIAGGACARFPITDETDAVELYVAVTVGTLLLVCQGKDMALRGSRKVSVCLVD